jgi:hypothetical protein
MVRVFRRNHVGTVCNSLVLVFQALEQRRAGNCHHTASHRSNRKISYVLRDGSVVEQGYRSGLEAASNGAFEDFLRAQAAGVPAKHVPEAENVLEGRPSFTLSGRSSRPISVDH